MSYINYPNGNPYAIPGSSAVPPNTNTIPPNYVYPNFIPPIQFPNVIPQQIPVIQAVVPKVSLAQAFKPKKAGKSRSHIVFLLDDSYSMKPNRDITISGYNEYLSAQIEDAKQTGIKTAISLYKFDGQSLTCVIDHVDSSEVPMLSRETYNPNGGTNLNDAMGGIMMKVNELLSKDKKKDRESVIITVLTDGEENASKTFTNSDVKAMVEKSEGKNWGFMFLGSNVDAFVTGSALGFNINNTVQYTGASTAETMRSASAMTSRMKSAYSVGETTNNMYFASGFTDEERTAAVSKSD